jgi:hypothetical protein
MVRRWAVALWLVLICAACHPEGLASAKWDWNKYHAPDWRKYRAGDASLSAGSAPAPSAKPNTESARFTFHDLKTETDATLVQRLLGQAGQNIAYVDRYKWRWRYYSGENDPAEFVDLYTQPHALGSQYGLCGSEDYSFSFDDKGHVYRLSVTQRYGIEGPVFQWPISDRDWDYYEKGMCDSVPASHAPSYFPATNPLAAEGVPMALVPVIDLAASPAPLPYLLACRDPDKHPCRDNIRRYLGQLRLKDIDEFSLANCPPNGDEPGSICFTIKTGDGRLGPFPKWITVKGSDYMNRIRVDSVDVEEGFTMS